MNDLYRTPPDATRLLLSKERFDGLVWEPACGDGAISKELEQAGLTVVSSDLRDYGYGIPGINFLECETPVPNIVTNPKWGINGEWIPHCLRLASKVALLLPIGNLAPALAQGEPLRAIHVVPTTITDPDLGWKILGWHIWERGYEGPIVITLPDYDHCPAPPLPR